MKLLAVVVNYRTPDLSLRAVESLLGAGGAPPGTRVVIVDNDSGDGSPVRIRDGLRGAPWADRVSLLVSDHNGGFGFGINQAVRAALAGGDLPEYVYQLNPDAQAQAGAVAALIDFLDARPEAGIAGSVIERTDGRYFCSGFRFPSIASEFEGTLRLGIASRWLQRRTVRLPRPTEPRCVDWISGVSFAVRRRVFEEVGLMDEGFFLYFEETDLCRRARAAGWQVWSVPESCVWHIGSASTGFEDHARQRPGSWFDSRRRYLLKHHGRAHLWLANCSWLCGACLAALRRAVGGGGEPDPPRLLRDFVRRSF